MTPTERKTGPHSAWQQGDLVRFRIVGVLDLRAQHLIIELTDQQVESYGYCLTLIEAQEATGISPEARRDYGKWAREHKDRLSFTAIIGANGVMRILSGFLMRAVAILTGGPQTPVAFVRDEAEAQEVIERERVRLRTEAQRRSSASGSK
jgi:hypothetical protein